MNITEKKVFAECVGLITEERIHNSYDTLDLCFYDINDNEWIDINLWNPDTDRDQFINAIQVIKDKWSDAQVDELSEILFGDDAPDFDNLIEIESWFGSHKMDVINGIIKVQKPSHDIKQSQ